VSSNAQQHHQKHFEQFAADAKRLETRFTRIAWPRFGLFLAASVFLIAWWNNRTGVYFVAATVATIAFVALGIFMMTLKARIEAAERRRDIHARHLLRLQGRWQDLPSTGAEFVAQTHPYAWDLDLVGAGSLFQRIDTTHTTQGGQRLADWLCEHASIAMLHDRQAAVKELCDQHLFRQELEHATIGPGKNRLDALPFLSYLQTTPITTKRRQTTALGIGLPLLAYGLMVLGAMRVVPVGLWLVPFGAQLFLWYRFQRHASDALDWLTARFDFADAFGKVFSLVAHTTFSAPYLQAQQTQAQGALDGLTKLRRWVRAAELRQQGLLHTLINPFLLWDLHCALKLDSWKEHHKAQATPWFEAVATLEALSALASYAYTESRAAFPEIVEPPAGWQAQALGHPLLAPELRVCNDVSLPGPGSLLIVTGSNMAGKSTLLRATGLNTALALAGGPVCATSLRLSVCRLRASMRIQDSLQTGASYFHSELLRLDAVLDHASNAPPVFFLMDELLRGTNAQARHEASRAVLSHLLQRGAMGMIATHDTELTQFAAERPSHIFNAHFTDVMVGEEMRFDYTLRPGPVRSSNAVRLVNNLLARHS
jgi:hypothetical protein